MKLSCVWKLPVLLSLLFVLMNSDLVWAQKKAPVKISRTPQSIASTKELPIITGDIYLLEKVVQSNGREKKIVDQKQVGRFITFSSYSSLSGYDGCNWFQHKYVFKKSFVQLKKQNMLVGNCDKFPFVESLPQSPFSVQYIEHGERLTLTSIKTKQKYYYRKNVAGLN